MRVFDLEARLGLNSGQFEAGMTRAQKLSGRVRGGLVTLGKAGLAVGAGLGAAGGAALAAGKKLGDYADGILDAEQQTGLTTDTLQEFRAVAREAGVPVGALSGAAERLTTRLGDAESMSKTTRDAFANLGVTVHDASGSVRSMDELMPEILGSLGDMENITERNAVAAEIFGRSYGEVAPVLALGTDRYNELTEAARENGDVMSREQLDAANDLRIGMENIQASVSNLGREFLIELLPTLQSVVSWVEGNLPAFREAAISAMQGAMEAWEEYGRPAFEAIQPLLENVVIPIVRVLATQIRPLITGAIQTIANILTGNFAEAWESFRGLLSSAGELVAGVGEILLAPFLDLPARFLEIGGDIMAGLRDGITGALDSVRDSVSNVADGIIGRFRGLLGIESPSTVFLEFGRNILEGLRDGLSDDGLLGQIRGRVEGIAGEIARVFATIALGEEVRQRLATRERLATADDARGANAAANAGIFADRRAARRGSQDAAIAAALGGVSTEGYGRGGGGDLEEALDRARIVERAQAFAAARTAEYALAADDAARGAAAAATAARFRQGRLDQDRLAAQQGAGGMGDDGSYAAQLAREAAIFGALGGSSTEGYGYDPRARQDAAIFGALGGSSTEGYGGGEGLEVTREEITLRERLAQALSTGVEHLTTFGQNVLGAAREAVPALDAAITGFAQGGPLGALTAVLSSLLMESEAFQNIMAAINKVTEPLVEALTTVLDALWPIIDVALALVEGALQPLTAILTNVVAPVFTFIARIVAGIWNAIARAVNWALGWLGVNLRTIDLAEEADTDSPRAKEPKRDEEDPAGGDGGRIGPADFSRVTQGVQLAVATPIVEASRLLASAAERIDATFGASTGGMDLARFGSVLDRLTPILERLVAEGVDLNVATTTAAGGTSDSRLAALQGVA